MAARYYHVVDTGHYEALYCNLYMFDVLVCSTCRNYFMFGIIITTCLCFPSSFFSSRLSVFSML